MLYTARIASNNTEPGLYSSVSTLLQACNEYYEIFLIQPDNKVRGLEASVPRQRGPNILSKILCHIPNRFHRWKIARL